MFAIYNWDLIQALLNSRTQAVFTALRSPGQGTSRKTVLPHRNTQVLILQRANLSGSSEQKKMHPRKSMTLGGSLLLSKLPPRWSMNKRSRKGPFQARTPCTPAHSAG